MNIYASEDLITIAEAAQLAGLHRVVIDRAEVSGQLPVAHLAENGWRYWERGQIEAFATAHLADRLAQLAGHWLDTTPRQSVARHRIAGAIVREVRAHPAERVQAASVGVGEALGPDGVRALKDAVTLLIEGAEASEDAAGYLRRMTAPPV